MATDLTDSFLSAVDEGEERARRSWPSLLATGTVGGIDIAFGLMAALLVLYETSSDLLASLAFGTGFIALTLARSELFTENFLVPVVAVTAGRARLRDVLRVWIGTFAMNLVGGWIAMWLIVSAFPRLDDAVLETGALSIQQGIGWRSFALALLGGGVITLLTWMERSTDSEGGRLVAAYVTGVLLFLGPLNHSVVGSLEMFGALQLGAPFGYLDWLGTVAWFALGNAVGGLLLVTLLRMVQVGRPAVSPQIDGDAVVEQVETS